MAILVVGSIAYDTIETPSARRERILGGSTSFFTLAAAPFAPVRIVGVVGDDFRQRDLDLLARHGGDLAGVQRVHGPTFYWAGRYHDDMIERDTLVTELGVFADFRPEIPPTWRGTPYLFLANIHPALQLHVLESMQSPALTVLDTMNFWIDGTPDDLRAVLGRVDVAMLNDGEARQLSGCRSLDAAAAAVRACGPHRIVIKKGEHGALYFGPSGVLAVPALILPEVVDPTGAGDAFAGGFVGSLAAAEATRTSDDAVFRRAMLDATVTASFCAEGFSVEGLLRMDRSAREARRRRLLDMMTP